MIIFTIAFEDPCRATVHDDFSWELEKPTGHTLRGKSTSLIEAEKAIAYEHYRFRAARGFVVARKQREGLTVR